MRKHRLVSSISGILLLSCPALAAPKMVDPITDYASKISNSKWTIVNNSSTELQVECQNQDDEIWIGPQSIGPKQNLTHKFASDYGDGLGFPESGVHFECRFTGPNQQIATVELTSLGWGDGVVFMITDQNVTAYQVNGWDYTQDKLTNVKFTRN